MTVTDEEFERMRIAAQQEQMAAVRTEWVDGILATIPPRYRDAALDHPEVTQWVAGFLADEAAGLLITGPTGVGKTHQAYAAYAECVRQARMGGMYRSGSVPALLNMCRPGNKPTTKRTPFHEPTEIDVAAELEEAKLVLLDDLGAEKPSDWTGEILYRVIDERYMNLRPTIVVSNVPPRELAATIGDRLASRLTEMCQTVVMKGSDRRRTR